MLNYKILPQAQHDQSAKLLQTQHNQSAKTTAQLLDMWQIILHPVSIISSYKILSDAQTRRSINMPRRKRHQVSHYGSMTLYIKY
jgi:hypothetical protein